MRTGTIVRSPIVEVELGGLASTETADHVRERITSLGRYAPGRIVRATVRFSAPTGGAKQMVIAHATVDVSRTQAVAHAAGATVGEATDQLRATLRRQLIDLAHKRRRRLRLGPTSPSTVEPDETALVRHLTWLPSRATPAQAVRGLEELGHEFGLFTNADTGQDCAIWRLPSGSYEFADVPDAPVLSEAMALERLRLSGDRFLFFRDRIRGRGRIVYHRGTRYGLISNPE